MSTTELTDEQLMARLSDDDDRSALADLVRRYQNDILRFCLHYLRDLESARELAQETFIRVYVARGRFDRERRFRPWILCIARNLCLNELKRKKAVPMDSLDEYASAAREDTGEIMPSSEDGPDHRMMQRERLEMLGEALASLDPDAREIVTLRFFEHLAARDIAEVMGSTEGAIRTRLHRILRGLREKYEPVRDDL